MLVFFCEIGNSLADDFKYNDLWTFNPKTSTWTEITNSIQGTLPSERDRFGFTAIEGKLFIFGGSGGLSFYGTPGCQQRSLKRK